MLDRCGSTQLRVASGGMGRAIAYGLDHGAVLAMGAAMGADLGLLADVLPACESIITSAFNGHGGDDDGDME